MFFIEVGLLKPIREVEDVLKRLGIKHDNNVYQTVHLLIQGEIHYIIHFKEYFSLYSFVNFGRIEEDKIRMNDDDIKRRNGILLYLLNNQYITLPDELIGYIQGDCVGVEYITDDLNFISKIRL